MAPSYLVPPSFPRVVQTSPFSQPAYSLLQTITELFYLPLPLFKVTLLSYLYLLPPWFIPFSAATFFPSFFQFCLRWRLSPPWKMVTTTSLSYDLNLRLFLFLLSVKRSDFRMGQRYPVPVAPQVGGRVANVQVRPSLSFSPECFSASWFPSFLYLPGPPTSFPFFELTLTTLPSFPRYYFFPNIERATRGILFLSLSHGLRHPPPFFITLLPLNLPLSPLSSIFFSWKHLVYTVILFFYLTAIYPFVPLKTTTTSFSIFCIGRFHDLPSPLVLSTVVNPGTSLLTIPCGKVCTFLHRFFRCPLFFPHPPPDLKKPKFEFPSFPIPLRKVPFPPNYVPVLLLVDSFSPPPPDLPPLSRLILFLTFLLISPFDSLFPFSPPMRNTRLNTSQSSLPHFSDSFGLRALIDVPSSPFFLFPNGGVLSQNLPLFPPPPFNLPEGYDSFSNISPHILLSLRNSRLGPSIGVFLPLSSALFPFSSGRSGFRSCSFPFPPDSLRPQNNFFERSYPSTAPVCK